MNTKKNKAIAIVEAGRKTEVEIFAGKVVSLDREYGVPTSFNLTILHII